MTYSEETLMTATIYPEYVTPHQVRALATEIERLQSRIADLEEERCWIPVSERLPLECQRVLVIEGNIVHVVTWHEKGWEWCYGPVSFWMPLPAPPEPDSESA